MRKLGILLVICLTNYALAQWIDPHDMNTKVKEKYMNPKIKKSLSMSSINEESVDPIPDICYAHLKRIVGVIMNSAHVDKKDSETYHGHIRFHMDPNEFDFLANFGKQDLTLDKLRKLDTVFSESFKRAFINEYLDAVESFQLKLFDLVVNIQNLWLLGVLGLLYVVFQLFKNDFSFAYVVKYLIIIVLIGDFGIRYHHLLEEAEEHNLGVTYSDKCDTSRMSWREWTSYVFSTRNCEKRTVTPLDVFLYQVKNIIIIPMHAFGTGMGGFGTNMFTTLPWGLNLIMWPFMLIFVLIGLLFFLTFWSGQSIEFNIFHLLKLKFGDGKPNGNTLPLPTVEKLMDKILHRPMVQIVQGANDSASDEKDPKVSTTGKSRTNSSPTKSVCSSPVKKASSSKQQRDTAAKPPVGNKKSPKVICSDQKSQDKESSSTCVDTVLDTGSKNSERNSSSDKNTT